MPIKLFRFISNIFIYSIYLSLNIFSQSNQKLTVDLKESGISLNANNTAAINVIFSDANSTAIIELQKTSNHSAA